jgi:hypothetical protein
VTYVLYSRTGEKKEEFKEVEGIIGAKWVDPVRFVMSRIDGVRESEDGVYSTGLLRCSVVMYDTAASETTVLKEATDTKNYWFDSVTDDGASVVIREVSVKSEKDWGDEEKTETREIAVEIPPAG